MQPHLEIRRIGPDFFTYSVRAGEAPACYCEDPLDSLARCLNDAADSLGHYFRAVSVSLDGHDLGSYPVASLLSNPWVMALELSDKAGRAAAP